MKIVEEYINPCRSRYVTRYNSLSEEQQIAWDEIDTLPKEKKYLKPIKRKRNPEIKTGTVFAMLLPENVYMYGKIISDNPELPMIEKGFFIAFITNIVTKDLYCPTFELSDKNILIGPFIIGNGLWKNGTFYTVGHQELTAKEKGISYGFYNSKYVISDSGKLIDKGRIINSAGKPLDVEPKLLEFCAYKTITGLEEAIRREIIINPQLIPSLD